MMASTGRLTEAEGWPTGRGRWIAAAVGVAVLLLAVLAVMVLPLHVPVRPIRAISTSYLAGYNNTVAIVGAGLLSVLVLAGTAWVWRRRAVPRLPAGTDQPLGVGWVVPVTTISALLLGGWWRLVLQSHERYLGDAGYMVEQASVWRETGRALYAQVEFAYGPLLVLPAAWIGRLLHVSTAVGYGVALVIEATLGLLMLAYVLNALPIRTGLRRATFVLLAIGAITPHLGLNYTYFRFISPLAVLLFATRVPKVWRSAVLLALGLALEMLISPELGFATLAGVLVFAAARVIQSGWSWVWAAVVPVAAAGLMLLALGTPYLTLLHTFTQGGFNLPVGPYPHIMVFLLGMVWLAPLGVGRLVRWTEPESGRLLAVYLTSLALSAAALGRSDPLHVMFNGAGILLLALLVVSYGAGWLRLAWVGCLLLVIFWNFRVNNALFGYRSAYTLKTTILPETSGPLRWLLVKAVSAGNPDVVRYLAEPEKPEYHLNMPLLEQLTGGKPVVTPADVSPTVEAQLKATHQYSPGYYAFWVNVMAEPAEQRVIEYVDQFQWMLIPTKFDGLDPQVPSGVGKFQGMIWHFQQRNPQLYVSGQAFEHHLEGNWRPVHAFGEYTLYEHMGVDPGGASGR